MARLDPATYVEKPVRVATRLGNFGEILHAIAPRVTQIVMNTTFRMFPDSAASQGASRARRRQSPSSRPRRWRWRR